MSENESDQSSKIAELESRIKELEHNKLVNLYGYSNLERAILTTMLTESIMQADDRQRALQEHYGTIRSHLFNAEYLPNDPSASDVKLASLKLAARLFQDVESRLYSARIISEKKLRVLD